MEFTDFNELKRLMKEGDRGRHQRNGLMEDDDFEFETNQGDQESYHKNQIYSYANASAIDNNRSIINPNNTYDTYKQNGAAGGAMNNSSMNSMATNQNLKRDRTISDEANGGGKEVQTGYEESSSESSSSSSDGGSEVDDYNFDPTKIQSIIEEESESDHEDSNKDIKPKADSQTSQQKPQITSQTQNIAKQEQKDIQGQLEKIEQKIRQSKLENINAVDNRKSSYQTKFEEKRAKEQLQKDIIGGDGEYQADRVLTFRDMSHLSYFGMKTPKTTNPSKDDTSIIQTQNQQQQQMTQNQSPVEIVKDLLNEIIDVVLGDAISTQDRILQNENSEIVNDLVLMNNFEQLRKKVFIKEKVDIFQGNQHPKQTIHKQTFKNNKLDSKTAKLQLQFFSKQQLEQEVPQQTTEHPQLQFQNSNNKSEISQSMQSQETSLLTTMIDQTLEGANDYLLPTPSQGDPSAISIKIYMFSTPKCLKIYIYRNSSVQNVIKHIMTLYNKDQILSKEMPLKYPETPDAYELRIIDDDVDYFVPFHDIGPLDRKDEIGEFESLAFIDNKNYSRKYDQQRNESMEDEQNQNRQEEEKLKKQNKRLMNVQVNTALLKTNMSFIMIQDQTVRELIQEISAKAGENFLNTKQFVLIPIHNEQSNKNGYVQPTMSQFGGQITAYQDNLFNIAQSSGRFDYDANYINWNTFIRNLKSQNVMLTDKVYVDMPIKKQKEVPMQKKKDLEMTFKDKNVLQLLKTTFNNTNSNNNLQVSTEKQEATQQFQNINQNSISPAKDTIMSQSVISPNRLPKMKSQIISTNSSSEKQEQGDHRQEDDFLFGSISAARYQEFLVTKINRRGKRQTRVLGIDGFNIYNVRKSQAKNVFGQSAAIEMPPTEKEKKRGSFFSGFLGKKLLGVKRKARVINSIDEIQKINNQTISIKNQEKPLTLKRNTQVQAMMMPQNQISASVQQPSILGSQKYPF